jgi:hypothetical protein
MMTGVSIYASIICANQSYYCCMRLPDQIHVLACQSVIHLVDGPPSFFFSGCTTAMSSVLTAITRIIHSFLAINNSKKKTRRSRKIKLSKSRSLSLSRHYCISFCPFHFAFLRKRARGYVIIIVCHHHHHL